MTEQEAIKKIGQSIRLTRYMLSKLVCNMCLYYNLNLEYCVLNLIKRLIKIFVIFKMFTCPKEMG